MKRPYYIITALCEGRLCEGGEFQVERKHVVKTSTSGQKYTTQHVKCLECKNWAKITGLEYLCSKGEESKEPNP